MDGSEDALNYLVQLFQKAMSMSMAPEESRATLKCIAAAVTALNALFDNIEHTNSVMKQNFDYLIPDSEDRGPSN
jgi:hypothetical protein